MERKVKGLTSRLMGFEASLWDSAAKHIDQIISSIGQKKKWLFGVLAAKQEEMGRWLQGNNKETDTNSAAQMVLW